MILDWVDYEIVETAMARAIGSSDLAPGAVKHLLLAKRVRARAKYFLIEYDDGRVFQKIGREIEPEFWTIAEWEKKENCFTGTGIYEEKFEGAPLGKNDLGCLENTYKATGVELNVGDLQGEDSWLKLPADMADHTRPLVPTRKGAGGRPTKYDWASAAAFIAATQIAENSHDKKLIKNRMLERFADQGHNPDEGEIRKFVDTFMKEYQRLMTEN